MKHIRADDPDGQRRWPKDGDGCRWDSEPRHPTATYVRLKGIGQVRVHRHRRVLGTVKTIGVKREGRRWYVVLSCDDVPAETRPGTGAVVGIDMGVASLVTTSDGRDLDNRRFLAASADRLAAAHRDLARKKPGSKRRGKGAVDPRHTSRTCARCGHCARENRLTQAGFRCEACGHTAHADVNAAENVLRAGLALREAA
uniref:RNA-guided endonuclease InsQ/TnpB family protein n=1 Tax=Herbidospora sakaeratensis TaxID=564415 RepID=UPI000B027B3A|nr:zinc ribbon domain-containing protein [Herbidospora sakaeratensis]